VKQLFYSLRSRIFLSVTTLVILLSLIFGWISIVQQTSSLELELIERGKITARHLSYGVEIGILTGDENGLHALLNKLLKEKDVLYAGVFDAKGKNISTSEASKLLKKHAGVTNLLMTKVEQPLSDLWVKKIWNHRDIYEFHMPVINEIHGSGESMLFDGEGDLQQQVIGYIHIILSGASIQHATHQTIMNGIRTFFIVFLLALFAAWWLARALTRPLAYMVSVIEKTQNGDFNQRIQLHGQNEMTQLAMAFNHMLEELAKRNEKLHEQQRTMQLILDTAPVGIWMLGLDRRMIFMNKAFSTAVGVSEQAFLNAKHYTELLPKVVSLQATQSDNQCFAMNAMVHSQEHIPCSDNKVHIFDVVKAPLRNNQGDMIGLVGIAIDATSRLQADAEKEQMQKQVEHTQRLESLGVLAGGIAHDFNNILTSIMGNAAMAERKIKGVSTEGEAYLSKIVLSSEKAALLCNQMLAYSGKGHFIVKPVNLSSMIESVTSLLGVSIHSTIELKYHLADQLPNIEADEAQLQQVIMNLVINASDAIGEDSGVVTITSGRMYADTAYLAQTVVQSDVALDAGDYVFLEVSDTGCGMSQEVQQHLFEPFFTTKFTGRGLGMSAVQGIIRGHQGAMNVYSELGQGTTFKVLFPASHQTLDHHAEPRPLPKNTWQPSGTVLVVDDEEMIREVSSLMLEDIGFDVLEAADGQEGIEIYQQYQDKIVAILLDMTMPRLDGEGCFRELKRINPDVKVILSSGYNKQDVTNRFDGSGLAGFVQKPYNLNELEKSLRLACTP